ncbi:MAG: tRNA (guanine(26)-N(2))-dimethyltransferase [Desulfurococcus sp.]|nr:tRNA (guanine(26)-N(2))-dimethyltransferase [Desulfurococcus sp.]
MLRDASVRVSAHEQVVSEGLVKIVVPRLELYMRSDGSLEPAWMPVFYNPAAVVSRDLTIAVLKAFYGSRDIAFIEPLAGTGVRGIRIAVEKGGWGILNDVDPRALYYMSRNIELNNLSPEKIEVYSQEANSLLNNATFTGIAFDYIDLDPYGSPTPFIDSAFKPLARSALIGISATDTAPLTCSHSRKALRRYWIRCLDVDFEKELGMRLLTAYIARRAAALDTAVKPLVAFMHRHYYRLFFKTTRNAEEAYRLIDECIGYIWYCPSTLERGFARKPEEAESRICLNGGKPVLLEGVWICSLGDKAFINSVKSEVENTWWFSRETRKLINIISDEVEVNNPYVRIDKLCSILKKSMPKYEVIIERLRELGVKATRTHFDPRGLRVNSDVGVLYEVLKHL